MNILHKAPLRTDRNNNLIAAAMSGNSPNQYTKALDEAGILWKPGEVFPPPSDMRTICIIGDAFEGARAILSQSTAIQDWYIRHTGKDICPKYNVQNNVDFLSLSKNDQNAVIKGIYAAEGGNGSLLWGMADPTMPIKVPIEPEMNITPSATLRGLLRLLAHETNAMMKRAVQRVIDRLTQRQNS